MTQSGRDLTTIKTWKSSYLDSKLKNLMVWTLWGWMLSWRIIWKVWGRSSTRWRVSKTLFWGKRKRKIWIIKTWSRRIKNFKKKLRQWKSPISRYLVVLTRSFRNSTHNWLSFRDRASMCRIVSCNTRERFMCWSWRLLNGGRNASTLRWESSTLIPIVFSTSDGDLKKNTKSVTQTVHNKVCSLSKVIISDLIPRLLI